MLETRQAEKWNEVGLRLLRRWNHQGAVRAFTQAIGLDAKFAEAYQNRAIAFRRLGMDDEADDDLVKAVAVAQVEALT